MTRDELLKVCFPGRTVRLASKMVEERTEDGDVIGHLDVRVRMVSVGLTSVQVAAMENLCVDPAFRRQGFATRLLETAHLMAMDWPDVEWAAAIDREGLPRLFEPLGYHRVEGSPPGFIVAELDDRPWPTGPIHRGADW